MGLGVPKKVLPSPLTKLGIPPLTRKPRVTNYPRNAPTPGTHRHGASPTNNAPTSRMTSPGGIATGNSTPDTHRIAIPAPPATRPTTVTARSPDSFLYSDMFFSFP